MDYCFHFRNTLTPYAVARAIAALMKGELPVIVCIGSDLTPGDCLGPVAGSLIRSEQSAAPYFVYGTLNAPVTAKEVNYLKRFFALTHPHRKILAIDAAVGEREEIGLIKISDHGLQPGSGVKKQLGRIGDISVLGIVADKKDFTFSLLNSIRFSPVYAMASAIAAGVRSYCREALRQDQKYNERSV